MNVDCIFCKIISREIPTECIVFENEQVLAFLDIFPAQKGHTLIVPKTHVSDLLAADNEMLSALAYAARDVGTAVLGTVHADGFNLVVNTHPAAGQVIFHLHWHIIPRWSGDGALHFTKSHYEEGEMATIGIALRDALSGS